MTIGVDWKKVTHEFDIIIGGNRFELQAQHNMLGFGVEVPRFRLTIKHVGHHEEFEIFVEVRGIEPEDRTGDRWEITGVIDAVSLVNTPQWFDDVYLDDFIDGYRPFHAWYNTHRRTGLLALFDEF